MLTTKYYTEVLCMVNYTQMHICVGVEGYSKGADKNITSVENTQKINKLLKYPEAFFQKHFQRSVTCI